MVDSPEKQNGSRDVNPVASDMCNVGAAPASPPPALNQYQQVNVQCTVAKREIYRVKEFIDRMNHKEAQAHALELFDRAYSAFDRLQAWVGSRG